MHCERCDVLECENTELRRIIECSKRNRLYAMQVAKMHQRITGHVTKLWNDVTNVEKLRIGVPTNVEKLNEDIDFSDFFICIGTDTVPTEEQLNQQGAFATIPIKCGEIYVGQVKHHESPVQGSDLGGLYHTLFSQARVMNPAMTCIVYSSSGYTKDCIDGFNQINIHGFTLPFAEDGTHLSHYPTGSDYFLRLFQVSQLESSDLLLSLLGLPVRRS